jgi:hypothetical protein
MVNSRSNQKNHVLQPLHSIQLHESYQHIRRLCIPDLLVLQSQANTRGRTTSFQNDARPFRVSLQRGQQPCVRGERRAKLVSIDAVNRRQDPSAPTPPSSSRRHPQAPADPPQRHLATTLQRHHAARLVA